LSLENKGLLELESGAPQEGAGKGDKSIGKSFQCDRRNVTKTYWFLRVFPKVSIGGAHYRANSPLKVEVNRGI